MQSHYFQIKVIRELSGFLGYHLTELKVLTLDDHLHIKNHRVHGAEAMANGNKEVVQVYKSYSSQMVGPGFDPRLCQNKATCE